MSTSAWKNLVTCAGALAALLTPHRAAANPDLPAMYGARSVGMGGTGVGFLGGATGGVFHNPALLDGVDKLEVDLAVSPLAVLLNTPISSFDPATKPVQSKSDFSPIPLSMLAVGYRASERITVGAGAYVSGGIGGKYSNLSVLNAANTPANRQGHFDDLSLAVAIFEATVPISVRIMDGLSIGAAWRLGYTTSSTTMVIPNPAFGPGYVNRIDQDVSGVSFLGASLGAWYQGDSFSLGLSYRSKMTMKLQGETDIEANAAPAPMIPTQLAVNADTDSTWRTPHQVRLGGALSLLDKKLTLALEGKAMFYEESTKELRSDVDLTGQPLGAATGLDELVNITPFNWKNAYTGQVGAEYWALEWLAVRAGFTAGTSATPKSRPGPILPTPGMMYSWSAGVGAQWEHWDAGLAAWYMHASEDISASDIAVDNGVPAAAPGQYDGNLMLLSVSAGYRM